MKKTQGDSPCARIRRHPASWANRRRSDESRIPPISPPPDGKAMDRPLHNNWIHLATITVTVLLWALILHAPLIYAKIEDLVQ